VTVGPADAPRSSNHRTESLAPTSAESARARQRAIIVRGVILVVVIAGAALLRLRYVAYTSLWRDESLVYYLGLYPLDRLWSAELGLTGIHPPLFYTIHHFWILLLGGADAARSTFAVRIPSVVIGVATVCLAYLIGRDLANRQVGLIAAALMAVWRDSVATAQEAKAQILVIFLMLVLVWSTARLIVLLAGRGERSPFVKQPGFWGACAGYVLAGTSIIYSHSTGPIGVVIANVMFASSLPFLNRRIRACGLWAALNILVVLAYIPWARIMASVATHLPGYYWLPLVNLSSPTRMLFGLAGQWLQYRSLPGAMLLAAASTAAVAAATVTCISLGARRRDPLRFALGVTVVCCPIIVYLPTLVSRPIFVYHVIASFWLPLFVLALAFAIGDLKPMSLRWGTTGALVLLSLLAIRGLPPPKEPWDKVADRISRDTLGSELILYWPAYAQWGTDFYLRQAGGARERYALELRINNEFRPFSEVPVVDGSEAAKLLEDHQRAFIVVDRKEMNSAIAVAAIEKLLTGLEPRREHRTESLPEELDIIEILPPGRADVSPPRIKENTLHR
jgi:hypothetical protein